MEEGILRNDWGKLLSGLQSFGSCFAALATAVIAMAFGRGCVFFWGAVMS